MQYKICSKCNKKLPISEYAKDKTKTDGLYSSCKDCCRRRIGAKKRVPSVVLGTYKDKIIIDRKIYPIIKGIRVRAHRYIMEQKLGRKLSTIEHVHHIDGNTKNFNLNNLIVLKKADHHKLHPSQKCKDGLWQICVECGRKKWVVPCTIKKRYKGNRKRASWYWCNKCANRKGGCSPKYIKEKIIELIKR